MQRKKAVFLGGTLATIQAFPEPVKKEFGIAIFVAQNGGKHPSAKPWKGEGPGVFELVDEHDGDAYRAVYTVRLQGVVYVLHAFRKKGPRGRKTDRRDVETISRRLQEALEIHGTL